MKSLEICFGKARVRTRPGALVSVFLKWESSNERNKPARQGEHRKPGYSHITLKKINNSVEPHHVIFSVGLVISHVIKCCSTF